MQNTSKQYKPDTVVEEPIYRSGAVARLSGIPVETLRVWERRYNIVGPRQSATGQRHYSAQDVTRLTVVKRLVDLGHAIGSIAALDLEQLKSMFEHASNVVHTPVTGSLRSKASGAISIAIVGEAIALRLSCHPFPSVQVISSAQNLALALKTMQGITADYLIIELPSLQNETAAAIRSLAQQLGTPRVVVEYGFSSKRVEQEMRALGYHLAKTPIAMVELEAIFARSAIAPKAIIHAPMPREPIPPRRFDNKALAEIALAAVSLNCECPHHLSDLLTRLGNFEIYSAECESRSPADAALHQYLRHIAGSSRAMLEAALIRVADSEGITLPPAIKRT